MCLCLEACVKRKCKTWPEFQGNSKGLVEVAVWSQAGCWAYVHRQRFHTTLFPSHTKVWSLPEKEIDSLICPRWLRTTHSFIPVPNTVLSLSQYLVPALCHKPTWLYLVAVTQRLSDASPPGFPTLRCRECVPVTISHATTTHWRVQSQLWSSRRTGAAHPREGGDLICCMQKSSERERTALQLTMCCFCQVSCVVVMWKDIAGGGERSQGYLWRTVDDLIWAREVAAGHFYPFLRVFPLPNPSFTTSTRLLRAELQQT